MISTFSVERTFENFSAGLNTYLAGSVKILQNQRRSQFVGQHHDQLI